jgi:2-iminoacetate synthase
MNFMEFAARFDSFDFEGYFRGVAEDDVKRSIDRETLDTYDFLNLLSQTAARFLEPMAVKARQSTVQYFGRTVGIYAPMYISDYCSNYCTYCGFNCRTEFPRTKLTLDQIEEEAKAVAATGIRHILVLTGEAPDKTPISYLEDAVALLARYFSSVALEIFPMDEDEYRILKNAGADSLTIYQEVYDREIYSQVHLKGRKSDYAYRILTPERGAKAGFRAVNIGPLFGLGPVMTEAFMAGIHAKFLERKFGDVEISLSLPRMTKAKGGIGPRHELTDAYFVQIMLAWRLFMPRLGITISTRESADFRDRLIHLGATRYSAGSRTQVGGYALSTEDFTPQFEITDTRDVAQIAEMIRKSGYQPVFKDWEIL